MDAARRAAEQAARTSYGRLLAMLAARNRDITAAEDALGAALASALVAWPATGVPRNPDAWLFTAARRAIGHARTRNATTAAREADLMRIEAERAAQAPPPLGDDQLKLLFACAHPAIDPAAQAPLMLQAVLGLDAARIAAAFVVSPAAMGQRLVRAKRRIRDAGIAFAIPEPGQLAPRLGAVHAAIYAAYGTGWDDATTGLAEEAIWLARVLAAVLPQDAETLGLLALMLYCEARRAARRDTASAYVPLDRQDPALWNSAMLAEAGKSLRAAAAIGDHGRYQYEAAIQSLHCEARQCGKDLCRPLLALYDRLVGVAPSLGALTARAVVMAEAGAPAEAIAALDAIAGRAAAYQPWWVARARCLHLGGDAEAAADAAAHAGALAQDSAAKAFIASGGLFAA